MVCAAAWAADADSSAEPTGDLPDGEAADIDITADGSLPDGAAGDLPDGEVPADLANGTGTDASGEMEVPADAADTQDGAADGESSEEESEAVNDNTANQLEVGTPDAGTTQSATGSQDSANYETYEDMVAAYEEDIASILEGDKYGNNIVSLYNPLNYIGADDTDDPTWTRIVMGASEGDMSMFTSLNLQIAMLNAGVDAEIEWQWNGGHVPSEIFGNSLALYVDQMYGEYVDGAATIEKAAAETQTTNGTAAEATGTDLSSWVNYEDISSVSFSLADAVAYRTAGASKAIPGFDVIDYGQEDYVFGNTEQDARHWNTFLLEIFQTYADVLSPLFNQG